jgi:hypothetical protein
MKWRMLTLGKLAVLRPHRKRDTSVEAEHITFDPLGDVPAGTVD